MGGQIFCPNLALTGTSVLFTLGMVYEDPFGTRYRYCKGAATIAAYEFCVISTDGNYTLVLLDTDTSGHGAGKVQRVACPQVALSSTLYGWVATKGLFTGKVAASCVQNVPLHATSTGGVLDDSATTTLLPGVMLITTVTGAASGPMIATNEMFIAGI